MTPFESLTDVNRSILVEHSSSILIITLNRPESLNSVDAEMMEELTARVLEAGNDSNCSVIVLTGSGTSFCSGKNMKSTPASRSMEKKMATNRTMANTIRALREAPQPVVAAVQGHAVGAGFALAVASDLRVVSPDARFGAPFVEIGMTPGDMGLSYFLPRIIGAGRAAQVFYCSGAITADQALAWGLASEISTDPAQRAIELATTLSTMPRESVLQTKEILSASASSTNYRDHLQLELRSQVISAETESHRNAMEHFRNNGHHR